jgi:uridine kinase
VAQVNADEVIARVAALAWRRIDSASRVLRVGIDGRDGAGKTTLADRLASALDAGPALILRSGIDGWHDPEAVRYRRGRLSPEGYYPDSFDLDHLKKELLDPARTRRQPGSTG